MELSDLWRPDDQVATGGPKALEESLRERGLITAEQMEQARSIHKKTPRKRLGQILLEMGVVEEADLLACLAQQYEVPFIRVEREMVDEKALAKLDGAFVEMHRILPLCFEEGKLVVATTDPTNVFLLDEVQRKTQMSLLVKVCPSEDIKNILTSMNEGHTDYQVDDIIKNVQEDDVEVINSEEEEITDLERVAGESPIIKFVNYIIFNAVKEGASDIHIEPGDKKLKVRYRIDGILFQMVSPPHNMHAPVVSRIKIMSNLDIAERRLPQDGRIRVTINGRNIDMRVSTLPTSHGEKVVIRILDMGSAQLNLTELGMDEDTLAIVERQIKQPHGIILVTGPTGSGKSTTLYAALRKMDAQRLNISTVEDPVEFQLPDITQTQVHEKIGMRFSTALRSLLRQDPDVIMVGEIRDEDTSRIAVQASLTGHLVLSTLHTNDAPSSITRLINIGVEPYLIAASTNAVLAQRLVRRTCKHCCEPYQVQPEEAGFIEMYGFNPDNLQRGVGCDRCRHTGFHGRIGIYELLAIDDTYRDIITKNPTVTELRRLCKERSMVNLREDGFRKVNAGLTTIDEVMRVTESVI
ncbi:MAG: hypothetical protein AMJ79_04010 [Phycisphaerae bacterium SM23_30]|nr:MAG: hypothetical protein AMJ79_04010 [Phycisphaerae bacterium SM23_30]